jgi:hypothetical protein
VIDRRSIIKGLGLLSVAPAIARASSLMNTSPGLQEASAVTVEAWVGESNFWNRVAIVREAGQVRHYINDILVPESEVLGDPVFSWLSEI